MTLDEAKAFLSAMHREELNDHAFGDSEVYWTDLNGEEVASGYYGSTGDEVHIDGALAGTSNTLFIEADARELRQCGTTVSKTRNDSGGR